ncbi:MAG: ABC transporter permease subunit, partial [Chloroflexaceae bacterium]|nr:ABC transporter permease subunit [Chloroflexaceae bacterium]
MANLSKSVDYLPSPKPDSLHIHSGTGVWLETGFTLFVWTCTALSVSLLFWIAGIVIYDAWPAIAKFGLGFVWGQTWSPLEQEFGALPYIYDTLVTCGLAIALALILGLTVAVFTSEAILPRFVRWIISFTVELFVALPSVVLLLWAVNVLAPLMYPLQEWLHRVFGWLPLFSPEPFGPSRLLAAIVLAIAILPTIAAISREVLLAIPGDLRSASMALGATRWEPCGGFCCRRRGRGFLAERPWPWVAAWEKRWPVG